MVDIWYTIGYFYFKTATAEANAMPRKPPQLKPIDPAPADATPEDLCADGVMQVPEAAAFCGVGLTTMKAMIKAKEVPSMKLNGRRVVPKRALVLYLAKRLLAG